MTGEDGVGAVELFEGDDEGEFVLEGQGAEGPAEVGLSEEALVVTIGAADDEGHIACRLLPLSDLRGKFAAGDRASLFVQDHAEASCLLEDHALALALASVLFCGGVPGSVRANLQQKA